MRVIIAGSRTIGSYSLLCECIHKSNFNVDCVVSGGASGVDRLGEQYARFKGLELHVYPAEWEKHGISAGYIRNRKMAENADALIAIWDGKSKGTANMIELARKKSLPVYVYNTADMKEYRYASKEEKDSKEGRNQKTATGSLGI